MVKKNIYSFLVALIIMYLSLAGSDAFEKVPFYYFQGIDKVVHAGMYFTLMSVIVLEHKIEKSVLPKLLLVSVIPLSYGIIMEFCQSLLTTTRSASIYDAFANLAGILLAVFAFYIYERKIRTSSKK